jgi:hypothetical protein
MTLESSMTRLNGTYWTTGIYRGHSGMRSSGDDDTELGSGREGVDIPAIPTNGLARSSGIILAIPNYLPPWGFWGRMRGYQGGMYQTLGSPEQSIIDRSFDCLVIEVQVIPPLLDQ